jgi:hypothetical protein
MGRIVVLSLVLALSFSTSPAKAANCGAKGGPACKIWERPGQPCNAGLIEKPFGRCSTPTGLGCGGRNQAACTILQRPGQPCNRGLQLTSAIGGMCVKPTGAEAFVKSLGSRTERHQKAMIGIRSCMLTSGRGDSYRQALEARDVARAKHALDPCLNPANFSHLRASPGGPPRSAATADTTGYFNTLSVGVAAGVQLMAGAGVEMGLVIDLNGRRNVRFYTVSEISDGLGLSIGGDITVALSRDLVPTSKVVTKDTSYNVAGKALYGGGIAVSFDKWHSHLISTPLSDFDGIGIAGGVGVGFDVLSKHQQVTTIW